MPILKFQREVPQTTCSTLAQDLRSFAGELQVFATDLERLLTNPKTGEQCAWVDRYHPEQRRHSLNELAERFISSFIATGDLFEMLERQPQQTSKRSSVTFENDCIKLTRKLISNATRLTFALGADRDSDPAQVNTLASLALAPVNKFAQAATDLSVSCIGITTTSSLPAVEFLDAIIKCHHRYAKLDAVCMAFLEKFIRADMIGTERPHELRSKECARKVAHYRAAMHGAFAYELYEILDSGAIDTLKELATDLLGNHSCQEVDLPALDAAVLSFLEDPKSLEASLHSTFMARQDREMLIIAAQRVSAQAHNSVSGAMRLIDEEVERQKIIGDKKMELSIPSEKAFETFDVDERMRHHCRIIELFLRNKRVLMPEDIGDHYLAELTVNEASRRVKEINRLFRLTKEFCDYVLVEAGISEETLTKRLYETINCHELWRMRGADFDKRVAFGLSILRELALDINMYQAWERKTLADFIVTPRGAILSDEWCNACSSWNFNEN